MTADIDAVLSRLRERPECRDAVEVIERLRGWKADALVVMADEDLVWEAAGRPGPLGASKSECVIAEIERLRAERDRLREAANILAAVRADAMWMARLARSSSWPGEMAHRVEVAAERVLSLLGESPVPEEPTMRVALADIDRQRSLGWPDFHPETFCHRCGARNIPSWWVDSDRFNAAYGPHAEHPYNGIVCPGCFVEAHEAATGLRASWRLMPDPFRPIEPPTPSHPTGEERDR